MEKKPKQVWVQCGRKFKVKDIEQIRETIELFPGLSRSELAMTLCENFKWYTAAGGLKRQACEKLLEKLAEEGLVRLPKRDVGKQLMARQQRKTVKLTNRTEPSSKLSGGLADFGPTSLELVNEKEQANLFAEYIERYHYLGYKRPLGCYLRYFVVCGENLVGCLLFAGAAKRLLARDQFIGWSEGQRQKNLPWVINNSRYLVFPWVSIKHLSSHVLGMVARQVAQDWHEQWGYKPLLMETFVDERYFKGTSYRAAGWIDLGETSGRGLRRPGREYNSTPKRIFLRSLTKDFREQLCRQRLVGRVYK